MAKNKTLNSYSGLLDADKIAVGMNAAINNSNQLLTDAKTLFDSKSYATALSLAILSIEEAGKVSILRRLACCNDHSQSKEIWKDYRNHRSKNAAWIIHDLVKQGARTLDDLEDCVDKKGEHTAVLDALKQLGFYTDCLDNKNWSIPSDVIDRNLSASIIKIAETLCSKKKITEREILLWSHFLRENQNSKKALMKWYEAMFEEGLSDITPDRAKKFVYSN